MSLLLVLSTSTRIGKTWNYIMLNLMGRSLALDLIIFSNSFPIRENIKNAERRN